MQVSSLLETDCCQRNVGQSSNNTEKGLNLSLKQSLPKHHYTALQNNHEGHKRRLLYSVLYSDLLRPLDYHVQYIVY